MLVPEYESSYSNAFYTVINKPSFDGSELEFFKVKMPDPEKPVFLKAT